MYQELKGKRLLILGGMRISCEIVKKAQAMGIYTLVADYNKIEDSPGKQIADEAVDLSVIDVDAVAAYVKENRIARKQGCLVMVLKSNLKHLLRKTNTKHYVANSVCLLFPNMTSMTNISSFLY